MIGLGLNLGLNNPAPTPSGGIAGLTPIPLPVPGQPSPIGNLFPGTQLLPQGNSLVPTPNNATPAPDTEQLAPMMAMMSEMMAMMNKMVTLAFNGKEPFFNAETLPEGSLPGDGKSDSAHCHGDPVEEEQPKENLSPTDGTEKTTSKHEKKSAKDDKPEKKPPEHFPLKARAAAALKVIHEKFADRKDDWNDDFLKEAAKNADEKVSKAAKTLLGEDGNEETREAVTELFDQGNGSISPGKVSEYIKTFDPDSIKPGKAAEKPDNEKAAKAVKTILDGYPQLKDDDVIDDDLLKTLSADDSIDKKLRDAGNVLLGKGDNGGARATVEKYYKLNGKNSVRISDIKKLLNNPKIEIPDEVYKGVNLMSSTFSPDELKMIKQNIDVISEDSDGKKLIEAMDKGGAVLKVEKRDKGIVATGGKEAVRFDPGFFDKKREDNGLELMVHEMSHSATRNVPDSKYTGPSAEGEALASVLGRRVRFRHDKKVHEVKLGENKFNYDGSAEAEKLDYQYNAEMRGYDNRAPEMFDYFKQMGITFPFDYNPDIKIKKK